MNPLGNDGGAVQFQLMHLRKLHCEDNNFVPCEPIESVQEVEVLSLKVHDSSGPNLS